MTKLRKIGIIGCVAVILISVLLSFSDRHFMALPFLLPFMVMLLIDFSRKK